MSPTPLRVRTEPFPFAPSTPVSRAVFNMATAASDYLFPSTYNPMERVVLAVLVVSAVIALCFTHSFGPRKYREAVSSFIGNYWRFAYACFFKPHSGDASRNQQDALESFYKAQASIYDATRERLLKGREEMLGMAAAQVKERIARGALTSKPVWCDVRPPDRHSHPPPLGPLASGLTSSF